MNVVFRLKVKYSNVLNFTGFNFIASVDFQGLANSKLSQGQKLKSENEAPDVGLQIIND